MTRYVKHDIYPRPEPRFPEAKIGMTYRDSKPDFAQLQKAPPRAPNVVVVFTGKRDHISPLGRDGGAARAR